MSPDTPVGRGTPKQFGSYEVVSLLGRGGMGEVFRAHDPRLDRKDGQRFILPMPATEAQATAYKIVLNWEAMVER